MIKRDLSGFVTPYGFVRCHQSHLVNNSHVSRILNEDSGYLVLDNGIKVPIAKQRKAAVKKELGG
ncbi:MAG: LytTR family DNA-binding domain-containing protein [Flavitalea sp.]